MVRAAFALLLVLLTSPTAWAQFVRDHNSHGLRSFHGQTSQIRRSFQSDAEARAIFKQILSVVGLSGMDDRINIRASADTDNAIALIERNGDKEERLILYNVVFIQEITRKTQQYWSRVAILAHELGHHIRFHTVIPGRDHEFELEADYQAGFILRRMGATLQEAQAAFKEIGTEAATPTHPARADRIQSVTLGWMDGGGLQSEQKTQPRPPPAAPKNETNVASLPPPTARRPKASAEGPGATSCDVVVGSRINQPIVVGVGTQLCNVDGSGRAKVDAISSYSVTYTAGGKTTECRRAELCGFYWDGAPRFNIDVFESAGERRARLISAN